MKISGVIIVLLILSDPGLDRLELNLYYLSCGKLPGGKLSNMCMGIGILVRNFSFIPNIWSKRTTSQQPQTCNYVVISNVMARSTEDSNVVPLVLVSNVVMNPHKLLPVFKCHDVSLISVATENVLLINIKFIIKITQVSGPKKIAWKSSWIEF